MSRSMKAGVILPLVALLLALAPAATRGQPRPPGDATVAGEVTSVNPLKVKLDNGQEQLLQTSPTVTVVREGKEVKLGDLQKGDKVVFTTNPDNSVQRMDVTDAASDTAPWLLIGLLVLAAIVVAGVVWYLTQRRGRGRFERRSDGGLPLSSHR